MSAQSPSDNPSLSFSICKIDAENGNEIAQAILAQKYMFGEKVERNEKESFKWYLKSAENGYKPAFGAVAYMFSTGSGIKRSNKMVYKKSCNGGNYSGCDSYKRMNNNLLIE
ncbi:TPA: tetratricopeptide repeat protein [Providencia rettgeri]